MTRHSRQPADEPQLGQWHDLTHVITALRTALGGPSPEADPDTLARLAGASVEERADALLRDPALRRAYATVLRAEQDTATRPRTRSAWRGIAGLAIAAGIGAVLLLPSAPRETPHRGDTPGVVQGITTDEGVVAWHFVDGADEYTVDIAQGDGRVVLSLTTTDTTLAIPRTALVPGSTYFARVRARIEPGRWLSSPFREFRVDR